MFSMTQAAPSAMNLRDPRMPDAGVMLFVRDLMQAVFDIDVSQYPRHVIPVTITATLDWVRLNGVWVLRNAGLYQTDEPYKFVFEYDQAELSPNDLHIFRDAPERNQFNSRIDEPGLSQREREEALGYVMEIGFLMWEKGLSRLEAEKFTPPGYVVERVLWATLMWVLSKNGRPWLYSLDPLVSSTYDFGVGYLYTPSHELLDPKRVVVHNREPHTCRLCGNRLWCVAGATLASSWVYVCNNCLVGLWREDPARTDDWMDERIRTPVCSHLKGIDQTHQGTCRETCPHSGVTPEVVWDLMEDHANRRVQAVVAETKRLGSNAYQQGGTTLNDLIGYFEGAEGAGGQKP